MDRLIACGLALVLATTGACASTGAGAPSVPAAQSQNTFDTRTAPGFGDATTPLKAYLGAAATPITGPQHFCIIGYNGAEGRTAFVHWREGNRMIAWAGAEDPDYFADSIKSSRRDLDLATDVVATEADIAGSTYLVTRAWVARVQADCAAKGARYTISR